MDRSLYSRELPLLHFLVSISVHYPNSGFVKSVLILQFQQSQANRWLEVSQRMPIMYERERRETLVGGCGADAGLIEQGGQFGGCERRNSSFKG